MDQSTYAAPAPAAPGGFIPIAIIGLGCRFPQAPDAGAFWRMMMGGVDAITEVPPERWDADLFYDPRPATPCKIVTRNGGFVTGIEEFDPYFFGISPREAVRMDPQQRLLLEVTWEAMERAGIPRERFVGSHTGVFVGVCTDDYVTLERGDLRNIDIYMGTGGARGSTAGRLAFAYGLSGPTVAVDTACSSSLVAVHEACSALQHGDCEMALAGGVNVVLHPGTAVAFSQANMLSPDGRCKAFDARADGFVRSEGAGIVLLKPLDAAIRDGDPVHAIIRGTASNNDGCSSPFMTPSRTGQAALLRHAYARAGVDPRSVQYVEAHGTGTPVGDPVEVGALADVVGAGRDASNPCVLGSAKTNIGHTEAAAGIAGLIKATLCLQHRVIPPNLHFETPNPAIPWRDLPFRVPTTPTPWPATNGARRAGVNSFGISGSNAHVVLEEAGTAAAATREPARDDARDDARDELLVVSAHTPEALAATASAYAAQLRDLARTTTTLRDVAYSAATRRTHHEHRLGVVADSPAAMAAALDAFAAGDAPAGIVTGTAAETLAPRPVFVFSGIATQWPGMGRRLRDAEPVFDAALRECDAAIRAIAGWSVIEEIDRDAADSRLARIDVMQPAIFAVQVALAALWRSWGVEPAAIVGHSLGEIAAAHVAGALSLDDAARVVCARSRLMHRASGQGRMAAVGLTADETAARIAAYDGRVWIAAVNGPSSCAISGDADAVESLAAALERDGVFCRLLTVDVACHSHHMQPLLDELATAVAHIAPRAATVPLYSTVHARAVDGPELDPEYWQHNLRDPVRFADTVRTMLDDGHRAFLELSPNPALGTPLRQIAQGREIPVAIASSLRSGEPERASLLLGAAALYVRGVPVAPGMHDGGRFVAPPPYAWQRERFWFAESADIQAVMTATATGGSGTARSIHPLLGAHWQSADDAGTHWFEAELDPRTMPWLGEHCVDGVPLLPAAAYVEIAIAASYAIFGPGPRTLRHVELAKALFLQRDRATRIQLVVRAGAASRVASTLTAESARGAAFRLYAQSTADAHSTRDEWTLIASGRIETEPAGAAHAPTFAPDDLDEAYPEFKGSEAFYAGISTGMSFGDAFRCVRRSWGRDKGAVTLLELPAATRAEARAYHLHPALLDGCFHSLFATTDQDGKLCLPFAIDALHLHALPDPGEQAWCTVEIENSDGGYAAEIAMYDHNGVELLRTHGYRVRLMETDEDDDDPARWLYETRWRTLPASHAEATGHGRWLVVGGADGTGERVRATLEAHGERCTVAPADATADEIRDHLTAWMASGECRGIVHLGALDHDADAPLTTATIDAATTHASRSLLCWLQGAARAPWRHAPRVFVVTRDAKSVTGRESLDPRQAPLAGFARAAAAEMRDLGVTQIDIGRETPVDELVAALLHADDEMEVALRDGARHVLRLARLDPDDRATRRRITISDSTLDSYQLESGGDGTFDALTLRRVQRVAPGPGEVEVRVAAVGLNFLDVLKALNMAPGLPESARFFGMECSGRVVAVGEGVTDLRVGDEVVALDTTASGCFRAFLTMSASAVFPKPPHLTLVEAATVPVAYQTAYYALCELGRLRAGESVLIHSAAGGVGLAALEIARQRGATVFATVGTDEKREYLRAHGVTNIMSSRTLDFADEVMRLTNGRGVDLVLNSLAGEAIPRSLDVLATGGRFLEIGKRDIYADSQLGLLPFQRNLSFFAIDLLRMRLEKPRVVDELTRDIVQGIADGSFGALPHVTFPASQAADAFRYMAQGKHIGKIVITLDEAEIEVEDVPAPVPVRADATYVITGGLGALGIAFARQLVEQGARHLALLGRSAPSPDAARDVAELRSAGARVEVVAADVSDAESLASALDRVRAALPPIRGVLHAAGVTADVTLQDMPWDRVRTVFASKVLGGWNIHAATRGDALDFFVLFSSAASVLGAAGQGNYAAANAFLDTLAQYRRSAGLPALAVNWGPWADVGMAALDESRGARMAERGLESIPVREGTELLDLLLQQRPAQIAVMPIAWQRWAEQFPEVVRVPFLSELAGEWRGAEAAHHAGGVRQELLACTSRQAAVDVVIAHLRGDTARVLRIPEERINPAVSLVRLGLDSLMAVELRNRIETDFGVRLPPAKLLQGPSLLELAEWLHDEIRASDTSVSDDPPATIAALSVAEMSDADVDAALARMLATGSGAG